MLRCSRRGKRLDWQRQMRGKAGTVLRVKQLTAADYDLVRKAEMERLYPDYPRLNLGYTGPHARELHAARVAKFDREVAKMPPAIPRRSGGTEPMIVLLFG